MACDLWTYENIKNMIAYQKISHRALDNLRLDFAREIDSKRRVSCIRNLGDLLDILERRDVISPTKIGPLEDICYILKNQEMINAISYLKPKEEYGLENEYALERIESEIHEKLRVEERKSEWIRRNRFFEENHQAPQLDNAFVTSLVFSGKKRDKVFKVIATEIGKKWRDFGREIKMREGEMDNLEADYPRNLKERVQKMLEMFAEDERVDPKMMMSCICEGLINCRRKDLSIEIQNILTR